MLPRPTPPPTRPPRTAFLRAALLAILVVAPVGAYVPPPDAAGLEAAVRPEARHLSPMRGMIALESGVLARIRFFGGYGPEPREGLPCHPRLLARAEADRAEAAARARGAAGAAAAGLEEPASTLGLHPQDAVAALVQWLFLSPDGRNLALNDLNDDPIGLIWHEQRRSRPTAAAGAAPRPASGRPAGLAKVAALVERLAEFQAAGGGADAEARLLRQAVETLEPENRKDTALHKGSRKTRFDRQRQAFAQILVRAAREGLAAGPILYPADTPVVALLAYAWQAADQVDELHRAFHAILRAPAGEPRARYGADEFHHHALMLAGAPAGGVPPALTREDLALYLAYRQGPGAAHPRPIGYGMAQFRGAYYPDCGETTLRNFFNYLFWDRLAARLDPGRCPDLLRTGGDHPGRVQAILDFYRDYPTHAHQLGDAARNAWSAVVSDLNRDGLAPTITYRNALHDRPSHNLVGLGLDNMLNLIAHLIPDPILSRPAPLDPARVDRLCALASRPGFTLDWHRLGGAKDLPEPFPTLTFTVNRQPAFLWAFQPGHFVLDLARDPEGEDRGLALLAPEDPWLSLWLARTRNLPAEGEPLGQPWRIFAEDLQEAENLNFYLASILRSPDRDRLLPTYRMLVARSLIPDLQMVQAVLLTLAHHAPAEGPWTPLPRIQRMDPAFKLHMLSTILQLEPGDIPGFCRKCLEHGADPRGRDAQGNTLLHLMGRWGSTPEARDWIMARGLDLDARNAEGATPAHVAIQNGMIDAFRSLLRAGARRDLLDGAGNSLDDLALSMPDGWDFHHEINAPGLPLPRP